MDTPKSSPLRTLVWGGSHATWYVSRARRTIHPDDLSGAKFFVGVSLKNPRFSARWLECVLRDSLHFAGSVLITLVDLPYFSSAFQDAPLRSHSNVASRLETVREQVLRRIEAARRKVSCQSSFVEWSVLSQSVDYEVRREVKEAFAKRGRFFRAVVAQTERTRGHRMSGSPEIYCSFLIEEIPTLVDIYYRRFQEFVDVYPGPNASVMWQLDTLRFSGELPIATELAASANSLTYAQVRLNRRIATS